GLLALILLTAVLDGGAWAAVRAKQVLVLHSTRRTSQIVVVSDREVPRILGDALGGDIDYYTEFVDQSKVPLHEYQVAFREFLRSKYKGTTFDVVIAMGDNALEFVNQTRGELFPESPVVFFAAGPAPRRPSNATGITARLDLRSTLDMAGELQPDPRNVFVVNSTDDLNGRYERDAKAQFEPFEQRFTFTYLTGFASQDLEERLRKLPPHSIVYFLIFDRDVPAENFRPVEYLDRLTAIAAAPTYSWVDSAFDHGIVGGSLKSQQAQIEAASAAPPP